MGKRDAEKKAERLRLGGLRAHLLVCTGGSCASKRRGRQALHEARREVRSLGLKRAEARVLCSAVGCLEVCREGPIAAVWPDGVFYKRASGKNLRRIVREHLAEDRVVEELCIARPTAIEAQRPSPSSASARVATRRR